MMTKAGYFRKGQVVTLTAAARRQFPRMRRSTRNATVVGFSRDGHGLWVIFLGRKSREEWAAAHFEPLPAAGVCRVCGCTDADCRQCIAKTGAPCSWVEPDLCSACVAEAPS